MCLKLEVKIVTVGELLRQTREAKGLTISNAVEKTYIQAKFIVALECNNYAVFPAESYLKGFLKIYAEYLGLDVLELNNLYKETKNSISGVSDEEFLQIEEKSRNTVKNDKNINKNNSHYQPIKKVLKTPDKQNSTSSEPINFAKRKNQDEDKTTHPQTTTTALVNSTPEKANVNKTRESTKLQKDKDKMSLKEKIALERNKKTGFSRQKILLMLLLVSICTIGWILIDKSSSDTGVLSANKEKIKNNAVVNTAVTPINLDKIELSGKMLEDCWVRVESDGKLFFEGTISSGSDFNWQAKEKIGLHIGNIRALTNLKLNQRPFVFENVPGNVIKRELTVKDIK